LAIPKLMRIVVLPFLFISKLRYLPSCDTHIMEYKKRCNCQITPILTPLSQAWNSNKETLIGHLKTHPNCCLTIPFSFQNWCRQRKSTIKGRLLCDLVERYLCIPYAPRRQVSLKLDWHTAAVHSLRSTTKSTISVDFCLALIRSSMVVLYQLF
jgi:hypothetical protein